MRPVPTSKQGFSLVWLCAILAMAGIMLAAILPGGQAGSDGAKRAITLQHMQKIEEATRAFMAANLRRPCPSDATQPQSSATFGTEGGNPGNCASANFVSGSIVSSAAAGGVPTKAIGLSDEYALDGYGRRIMYVVDRNATGAQTCHDLQSRNKSGSIQILSASTDTTALDYTMWALISYGARGQGAFPEQGNTLANRYDVGNTNSNIAVNAFASTGSMGTSTFTGTLVQQEPSTGVAGFDDTVWYLTADKSACALGKAANNGFHITGSASSNAVNAVNGITLAVGDINGDGFPDMIIGEPGASSGNGAVYVLFGSSIGWPVGGLATPTPLALGGISGIGHSITSVSAANPGAVSSALNPGNGNPVYISGVSSMTQINNHCYTAANSGGSSFTLQDVNGNSINTSPYTAGTGGVAMLGCGTVITNDLSSGTLSGFGKSIAVGDINGDGYDDIIIGGTSGTGTAQFTTLFGAKNFSSAALSGLSLSSSPVAGFFIKTGISTTPGNIALGDINKDGYKDIIFSDQASHAYAIFGQSNFTTAYSGCACYSGSTIDVTSTGFNLAYGFQISGNGTYPFAPTPSAATTTSIGIGDLDGDGFDDIVLGSNTYGSSSGGAIIIWGHAWLATDFVNNCTPAAYVPCKWDVNARAASETILSTSVGGDNLGNNVLVTDLNSDGYKDIVISSNSAVYGFYGRTHASWPSSPFSLDTSYGFKIDTSSGRPAIISGTFPQAMAVGDVSGDGLPDLILSNGTVSPGTSQGYTGTRTNAGSSFIIFQPSTLFSGSYTLFSGSGIWFDTNGNSLNSASAFRIDGLANSSGNDDYAFMPLVVDINHDGKNDVVIGAPGDGLTSTPAGGVYVLYGRSNIPYDASYDLTTLQ